jgi:hypothetical protein
MTTVSLRSPAETVGTVPHLIGFTPHNAAVVIGLAGKRVKITAHVAAADFDSSLTALGETIRRECSAVVVIGYGDTLATARVNASHAHAAMLDRADVRDVLAVSPERWTSTLCGDPACCPADGNPIPETTAATTALAVAGACPLDSREAIASELDPDGTDPHPLADILWPVPPANRDRWLSLAAASAATARAAYYDAATVCRSLPESDPRRDHALTAAAVCAYLAGDGARANIALDLIPAERARPNLAALLAQSIRLGIDPAKIRPLFTNL